jgi:antitoxin Xre/MbcA/ParS-like protein
MPDSKVAAVAKKVPANRGKSTARGAAGKASAKSRHSSTTTRTTGRAGSSARAAPKAAGLLLDRRADFVVGILGNQGAADLLEVNKSQPSRWRSGAEAPSPLAARRLIDLDYVLGRLLLVWDQSVAADWLMTPNGFLDGATPLEVVESRGTTEVIEAIEAEGAGAFS